MNRTLTPLVFAFGTSSLLLMDSAMKGSVILLGAACVAVMLKRDSAAMRHLVWLVAIVAMLFIPVLSVLLPRWQVLPAWAAISQSSTAIETPNRAVELPRPFEAPTAKSPEIIVPGDFSSQPKAIDTSHNSEALEQPRIEVPQDNVGMDRATREPSWSWMTVLPFLWSIGFGVLILRLMAARWMLWSNEQRATVIAVLGCPNDARKPMQHESDAAIASAFESAHRQLGIRQRVQLLIDSERTIPVVWGIFWIRLMLPDSARQWNSEQLRSVLLHELAHIKRRDTIVQLLAQFACALHWFNPLVWFAAWRLHVERERACDDLVLAQGVRASAYAEHLLNVATKLSVARWTSACGLAMASYSPLESRLHAILSDRLNRRKVSTAIGMMGLLLGAGIAIPIAMLRAAADDWTPPSGAHVGSNDFSAYCVHDGKNAAFVIAYQGFTGSSSAHDSNSKNRTWTDSGTITAKKPSITLSFHRTHTAPDKLNITTAPSEARDLSKSVAPGEFGQKEYDLNKGRVFLLSDNGSVRQLDIATPIVTDQKSLQQLAALIPVTTEKGAFTAWGKEVGGLQAGLGFKAGEQRVYRHGETATLVVRVRNVGQNDIKFKYYPTFLSENSPTVLDETGKRVSLRGNTLRLVHHEIPKEVNLAVGKEIELYERELRLASGNEDAGELKNRDIFPTGKFLIQHEKVIGNSAQASDKLDPTLEKLATGKLELEIKPVASVQQEAPKPKRGAMLQPVTEQKLKWGESVNGLRMALAWPPIFDDVALGNEPHFQLVVQNVSEKEIHFLASDEAPNPRELNFRADNRTVLVLADEDTAKADWHLLPGHCGVLRMFTKEGSDDDGKTVSAGIEGDLSKIDRNHAVAEMEIAKAPVGAWTGNLISGKTRGSADVVAAPAPMHKDAKALFEEWQRYARANGDIPGALVGELAAAVKQFIKYNPTWETVPKLKAILPRLDATRDWKPADTIALLDEVAGIQDSPLSPAPWKGTRNTIRQGDALPKKYSDVSWGEEQPNGLRVAWVLEPSAAEHRIGAAIKARLLVQNRGQVPVMLQAPTWHQGLVKASDANGKEVEASGLEWTTMAMLNTVRLGPGAYIEINTPGVGIGPRAGMGPWAGPRVGSNVLAKPGDELTLTYSLVPLDGSEVGISEEDPHVSGPLWWLAHIKSRLNRELPLPTDAAERTRLLDRAVRELFATEPTAEETATFIADKTPEAIDTLAKRLTSRTDVVSFSGKLPTAPVKFRVLDADANADKQPRVVLGPGEYPLPCTTADRGDATLKIVGKPVGDRRTNEARILFEATEATGRLPPDPHKLDVPDGWGTWAIVCRPNDGYFYLLSKGSVRKIDYNDPRNVTDTPANDLPAEFRDEVKRQLDIAGVSAEAQAEIFEKPAPPAALPDPKTSASTPAKPTGAGASKLVKLSENDYTKIGVHCQKFLEEDAKRLDGKLMGHVLDPSKVGDGPLVLGLRVANDAKWNIGSEARVELVVRNQSKEDMKFAQTLQSDVGLSVVAIDKDGRELPAKIAPSDTGLLVFNRWLLPKNGYVTMVKSFAIRFNAEERFDSDLNVAAFHLPPGDYKLRCKWNDAQPEVAHEGEWTGELVNEELGFTLNAAAELATVEPMSGAPVPQATETEKPKTTATELQPKAPAEEPFTAWGKEVNGLQAGLGFKADEKRAYHHGETANVVLRVRNVGKEAMEFKHIWAYFVENPPVITDAGGKSVHLPRLEAEGEHGPDSPKIAPGKGVELYEWKLELKPETPRLGRNVRVATLYGTGKFGLQCERIVGPTSGNPHDPNPAMSKLATGKLELEIQPVALVQQETPAAPPTASPPALAPTREGPKTEKSTDGPAPTAATGIPSLNRHGTKLRPATEEKLKWGESVNGLRAALVMQPVPDEPDAEDKYDIFLVVQNVTKAEVWLHASDAAPNPRQLIWRDKGVLETVTEVAKPIPTDFRLQPGEVAFFRMTQPPGKRNPGGRSTGSLVEEFIRKDPTFSLEGSMEISTAPIGAWSGKLLSGRTEGGTAIPQVPEEAATVFLEVKGKDANGKTVVMMSFEEMQRDEATSTVRTTYSSGGSVGSSLFIVRGACEIAKARGATYFAKLKEWNGEDGTWMYIFGFSKNKDIRPLANEHELKIFAVSEYEFLFMDAADANVIKVPDNQYMKSGVPVDELAGEGMTWNDVQNGLSLGYRITSDEWRILGEKVKVELWVQNHGDKDVKFQDNMRADPEFGLRVKLKDAKGEDHNSNFWPDDRPPFGFHRLLPPGHALKVKEFTISLFLPENDFSHAKGHFLGINPGAYNFHCELALPGFSATGEGGKQLTPAAGEWTGKLTTRGLNIEVIAPDAPAPEARIEPVQKPNAEQDGEKPIKTIPVTSKELSGIWYGATDRTGVVVRFIGRESRIKDTQGVVNGQWVVNVVDGSVGATLDFTNDPKAGVVRITAGMWDDKTKQSYTSSLGSVERGEDDTLYLTIDNNPKEPMYLATKRIPLTFIQDRAEIQRSDVEKMQSLMRSLKPR